MRRRVLPKSLLGQAIAYTLGRWEALTRYVADGRLEIDNNLCENSIRPTAVGKKNFLFVGHPQAGQRNAVIYSVLGSCRRHGVTMPTRFTPVSELGGTWFIQSIRQSVFH